MKLGSSFVTDHVTNVAKMRVELQLKEDMDIILKSTWNWRQK